MSEEKIEVMNWQEWNRQGLIPGPEETEEEFKKRAVFCLNLKEQLRESLETPLPFEENESRSAGILEDALPLSDKLYGIKPEWVPLFFGNHQLAPWHGGCAWIFQLDQTTPTSAFLQLRANFRNSPTFLNIYHRRELIAHELAHVGRMLYQAPQFEEFFAYQSSPSSWRRWFGPIVQSSKESFFFVLLLALVILTDISLFSIGPAIFSLLFAIKMLPVAFILLGIGRLIYRHQLLKSVLRKLETLLPTDEARHLLYRLLDHEIKRFSKLQQEEIISFIKKGADLSFRWRFLKAIYFTL